MLPKFNNPELLTTALSHRSSLNEADSGTTAKESYERFEFLGDAVLELVTTEFLFAKYPTDPEGVLTAYRSALVKTTTLASIARKLELGKIMFMSRGEEATGGRENEGLLADVFEAVIGGLYLDQGYEVVKTFLNEELFPYFEEIKSKKLYKDSKSALQEAVQASGLSTPEYKVINEEGPDHEKTFTVEVIVANKVMGQGTGKSKQIAQQEAATQALSAFEKK
ncbi:MAG: ribonuclease III [Candidatus Pacebacteria bacterium CG10_big_fil_rev_8_21_14_0_10_36_11]|nr:ribonuclease III [Candidatus Pacearchaeota archaeon]OIP74096.1 MAG: ribonuclease III [Candidatus Pacebacteria bacterium CG2_30_36_39]PIR64463.1 MAG: ribonuclease III [Candidatus Pacebacteria bacterium CG10_big_fil_rev_8_21_14_0_10_36_11]PJC42716.1 MAG: ribonuclease III [Candidatus Pacebacteria bacterium CG_4_9_14_0_2_um_filter_36_8]